MIHRFFGGIVVLLGTRAARRSRRGIRNLFRGFCPRQGIDEGTREDPMRSIAMDSSVVNSNLTSKRVEFCKIDVLTVARVVFAP